MTSPRPSESDVIAALERVLASEVFARSDRARKLLDYLVRAELAGRADRLKGFSIAVDVFGKDADFDPATDAVVRVQAGRLRELLDLYYGGAGAEDEVRIAVPKGSYVPMFSAAATTPALPASVGAPIELDVARINAAIGAKFGETISPLANEKRTPPPPPGLFKSIDRHIKLFRVGLAFIIVMLGFVTYRIATSDPGVTTEMTATVRGARGAVTADMLPTIRLVAEPGGAADAFAARLRAALPAFDTINFINAAVVSPSIRADEFAVRVAPDAGGAKTLVQIEHVATGSVIASRTFSGDDTDERAFTNLLDTVFPASGAIYAYVAENELTGSLTRCLTLENRFYLDLKAEDHRAAYECFEQLANAGAKSPLVWAELANLQVSAVKGKFIHLPQASLAMALKYARKGVELGPGKATAYRALGFVLVRTGEVAAGLDWMRKAVETNPYDMSLAASAGDAFVMAGDYEAGVKQLDRAVHITPLHPHWWDYSQFLGAFMTGDKAMQGRAADALTDSDRRHYIAARLVVAHDRGNMDEARTLAATLVNKSAGFATDPEAAFRDAGYPPDLASQFSAAIRTCLTAAGAV